MTRGTSWRRIAVRRGAPVEISVDGRDIPAFAGESVAAAMLAAGAPFERDSADAARAPLCNMGTCFECCAIVDGRAATRTCLVPVEQGITVETRRRL